MIAARRLDQPTKESRLNAAVRNFLAFIESPQADIPFEARLELKRRHHAELRAALEESERRGATLTEVLIALLIMSIGIVALAVIFPISVQQTVKATQLTHGTDLRFNAEALIDQFPKIITAPNAYPTAIGFTPDIRFNDPVPGTTQNYVVDPLGYLNAFDASDNATPAANRREHWFGNDALNGSAVIKMLPRYALTWRTISAANSQFASQDSWAVQFEGQGTAGANVPLHLAPATNANPNPKQRQGIVQLTIPGLTGVALNQTQPGTLPFPAMRAVIFSADGSTSQIRNLLQINGNEIFWSENTNGIDANGNGWIEDFELPQSFVMAGAPLGNVRIEQQEFRYSYLLTVRRVNSDSSVDVVDGMAFHRVSAVATVDVAVFFGRQFDLGDDEGLYPASFSQHTVAIKYAANRKPFMRKGGFVFDANNAYWYRISNVADSPATGAAIITIESPVAVPNPSGMAMFYRNVVDVYSIGAKDYRNVVDVFPAQ